MRLKSRISVGLSAGALVGAGIMGFASPASAAVQTVNVGCTGSTLTFTPSSSLTIAATDTIQISIGPFPSVTTTLTGATGPSTIGTNSSADFSPTGASGSIAMSNGSCTGTLTFTTGGGGSSSDTSNSTPQLVLQQFGKPATGTCDAAATEMLNIGGAESGGWSESWAEWMNGGLGGAVCTRTLDYSNALGHWVVG